MTNVVNNMTNDNESTSEKLVSEDIMNDEGNTGTVKEGVDSLVNEDRENSDKVIITFDLNEPKDSSKNDKAAQNGRTPKSLTLEIHHGGCFTPIHSRLGLDYGLHSLNVDADVLEMANYVKDYMFIWLMLNMKVPSSSVEAHHLLVECVEDPFEELDDLLGEYAHIGKQITGNEITGNEITRNKSTRNEITGKQMVVHVGNSSIVDDVLELGMLFETKGVGPVGKFKEVEVDADNESEEESDTEGDYTMDSDSEDLDYDPKHDDVFDDDEHIVEEVYVNMNNFRFMQYLKRYKYRFVLMFKLDDLCVIDYDSFGSDLDDGIDLKKGDIMQWEVRILIEDHTCIQSRAIKACTSRFLADHVIKSLAINPDIPLLRQRRIASDIMTGSYKEQFSLFREYGPRIDPNQKLGPQLSGLMLKQRSKSEVYYKELLEGCSWPGQILTAVEVDANNEIYLVAYVIVEAESKASWCWFLNLLGEDLAIASVFPSAEHRYCVRHIHENMKSQFKGGVYKEMLWNAAKATSEDSIRTMEQSSFFRQSQIEYLMKRIVVVQKVIAKTVGPLTPSVKKMFDAIKKRLLSTMFNGMEEVGADWNTILETWAHVYSFKVNPCNGRDMWPVVESRTVIIPPLYKPPIGRPPKKRKTYDEIESLSASPGKLSRKGKSVSCGKCGNVGHNRKGCRGQGGGSSQAGARKVSGQAAGATNVSGQVVGARKVSGLACWKVSVKLVDERSLTVNPVQHKAQQNKDQGKVFRDQ
ncbi:hypothetical protein Tco_0209284 [Tanacetum coccineum]